MTSPAPRLHLVKNTKFQRSGPKSYARAIRKYNITPTKPVKYLDEAKTSKLSVLKRDKGAHQGKVSAQDVQHDSEYICPVDIGTPPQTLNLDFDTGSSDMWVWSTHLPLLTRHAAKGKHHVFDPAQSSTWTAQPGARWTISYGDGSAASGSVGTDHVTIAGLTIPSQAVEVAHRLSSQFTQTGGDGLLGLAFDALNTVEPHPVATPVTNLTRQDRVPALFTAHLGSWRDAAGTDAGTSFYTFGAADAAVLAHLGPPHWTPITTAHGFWEFASAGASVNGRQVAPTNATAIADTGTSLALLDDATCAAFYAAVPGARYDAAAAGWLFPADAAPLPELRIDVGGRAFELQKADLAYADAGAGFVFGGVQSAGDMGISILGDVFLKSVYAIFDVANKRLGLAQRTESTQDSSVSPAPSQ